jgi:hypothetical protein
MEMWVVQKQTEISMKEGERLNTPDNKGMYMMREINMSSTLKNFWR